MIIIAIESSCDDTSVSLLDIKKNNIKILAEKTASQIEIHKKYGGVVPEIAARIHAENIVPLIEEVLKNQPEPETIAVTAGPGLITGLIVGVEAAKTLAYLKNLPIVKVNHIEGHINSIKINNNQKIDYPLLSLVISGGHTDLILENKKNEYKKIGGTRDDAVGECFDKVAKMLNLEYPGGPKISALAKIGNENKIKFPRPMIKSDDLDMSFAGLKTAVLYWLKENKYYKKQNFLTKLFKKITIHDICASFEKAISDILILKTKKACEKYNIKNIIIAGGVSANEKLRKEFKTELEEKKGIKVFYPEIKYAMDNATMIGVAAYEKAVKKEFIPWQDIQADPNWEIY
ncbi:MAG: tRNA (adenosine(37)-N6)-threonylcarbamoyltransferase complex transferase subunit TsaD [Patescibacteria group bacterium]